MNELPIKWSTKSSFKKQNCVQMLDLTLLISDWRAINVHSIYSLNDCLIKPKRKTKQHDVQVTTYTHHNSRST